MSERIYYHVAMAVQDLDEAMLELTRAVGIEWGEPRARENGGWRYRVVYSITGPPYMELVDGPPGSPWETTGGSRLDHVGWWSAELDGEVERMLADGLAIEMDGRERGIPAVYLRAPSSGLRIELLDEALRKGVDELTGVRA